MGLSFEPGEVLCAKYRVEGLLGTGGMGIVIAAEHIHLGERVALKILRPDLVHDPRLVSRFEREARAAAKIRSQHVARVSDVGRLESGLPFMVMEYLHGWDLGDYLKQHGALQLPEAADYVLQACEAIAEAHALGIVHRDLKPENLFLTTLPDGTYSIKVLDFGISKVTWLGGSSANNATVPRAMMGSPLYMSPEQLRSSADVDERADIWALGVILYELLTRETPFVADSLPQLCTAILEAKPIPIATYRSDLPPAVAELIDACLHKACADRIATVADFAQRLAELGPPHARLSAQRIARIAAGGVHTNRPRAGAHGTAVEVSTPPSTDGTLALAASPAKESPAPAAARVPTPETAPATPAGEGSAGGSAVPPGESPVVGRVAPPTPDGPAAANAVLPAAERPALPIVPARAASAMPSAQRPVRAIVLAAATALAGAGLIVWLQPCATAPAPNEIHVAVPVRGKVAASPEPASRPARTPVTSAPTAAEPPPALPVGVVTMPKPVPAAPATTPVRRSPASRASRAEAPSGTRPVSAAAAGADRPVRTKSPVERKRTAAKPPSESIPVQQRPLGGRI